MSDTGDQMLSIREVCQFFGGADMPLDQSTIYRWVRLGKLPPPVRVGPGTLRWKRSECQLVLDGMAAARAAKAAQ